MASEDAVHGDFSKKNKKKNNKPTVTLKGTSRPITSGNYALEIRKV